jgi:cysteine desulfurase
MFPKKSKKIREVYLDNAASTKIDPEVKKVIVNSLDKFSNPSSLYKNSIKTRKEIESSRKKVEDILFAQNNTVFFTGSGTESINMAILGVARAHKNFGKHIITTKIEHHAVLNPIKHLETKGFKVTYLDVDKFGNININDFKKALRKDTILVSIMYANNEIGTVMPIRELGREIIKHRKANNTQYPYFHTDACQAGSLDLNVEKLHTDLMSLNGGKIHGPKGAGIMYKQKNIKLHPVIFGGEQEQGLRPSTENISAINGFACALELAQKNKTKNNIKEVRDYFYKQIKKKIKNIKLTGPELNKNRLQNSLSIIFEGVDSESLILYLDEYGIMCSSGSACTTDSDELSHVLIACGLSQGDAKSSIRFTLSKYTSKKDIDYVMKYLPEVVKELRKVRSIE